VAPHSGEPEQSPSSRVRGPVDDRHRPAVRVRHDFCSGIKLLCQRFDDGRTQPRNCPIQLAFRFANSVVGNRKSPVRCGQIISNNHDVIFSVTGECMLDRINHEFSYDDADADSLARRGGAALDIDFQGDRSRVAHHRGRQGLAQSG
jgi:hypothetical protein